MIHILITDLSRVLLFPKDISFEGSLNMQYTYVSTKPDFVFLNHFTVNTELLDFYTSLKEKVLLYVFTSGSIQDAPELQSILNPIFTHVYSAKQMGVNKKNATAYVSLANAIGKDPSEILYIDDNKTNIEAAKDAGCHTILYSTNKTAKTNILKYVY